MSEAIKFILPDDRIPKAWYNLPADLPQPLPPVLNAATCKPVGADELTPLFPMSEILQEVSTEREIEIPDPVRDVYRLWRPTPLAAGAITRTPPRYPGAHLLQGRKCSADW